MTSVKVSVDPGAALPPDAVEPRVIPIRLQMINGGCYLTFDGCKIKSTLPENYGAPRHCAAGLPQGARVQDVNGRKLEIFDGAVLAICPYSGMNVPVEDGKRRVHWGDGESTCSHPLNQE